MSDGANHSKSEGAHAQFFTMFTSAFACCPTTQLRSRLRRWYKVYREEATTVRQMNLSIEWKQNSFTWRPKRQRSARSELGLHTSKSSCPGSSTSSLPKAGR
jgi:hypothetical protein